MFDRFDMNGDGRIDLSELESFISLDPTKWNMESVRELMAEMDKDGDGRLSSEEFVRWILMRDKNRKLEKAMLAPQAATKRVSLGACLFSCSR